MHKVKIDAFIGNENVSFCTYEEVMASENNDGDIYKEIYRIAKKICEILNIEIPYIALGNILISVNEETNVCTETSAIMYTPDDVKDLDNNLVYLGIYPNPLMRKAKSNGKPVIFTYEDLLRFSGILSHELRHIWQKKYRKDAYQVSANGMIESLYNRAEIDADAFAIAILSRYSDKSIDEAGSLICNTEKELFPEAYKQRIALVPLISKELPPNAPVPFRHRVLRLLSSIWRK